MCCWMTLQFSVHTGWASFFPVGTRGMRYNQLYCLMQKTRVCRSSGNSLGVHHWRPEVEFKSWSVSEGPPWGSQWPARVEPLWLQRRRKWKWGSGGRERAVCRRQRRGVRETRNEVARARSKSPSSLSLSSLSLQCL